jgi:hypothetical protein
LSQDRAVGQEEDNARPVRGLVRKIGEGLRLQCAASNKREQNYGKQGFLCQSTVLFSGEIVELNIHSDYQNFLANPIPSSDGKRLAQSVNAGNSFEE